MSPSACFLFYRDCHWDEVYQRLQIFNFCIRGQVGNSSPLFFFFNNEFNKEHSSTAGTGRAPKLKNHLSAGLPEEMSREMCLQTISSTVKLELNAEFLMPECFYLSAVSLCGDWLRSWQSAWERGSASSDITLTRRPAAPPLSGDGTRTPNRDNYSWLTGFINNRWCRW